MDSSVSPTTTAEWSMPMNGCPRDHAAWPGLSPEGTREFPERGCQQNEDGQYGPTDDSFHARTIESLAKFFAIVALLTLRRSKRWSPTRKALAMIVKAGFTALLEGKKLPSTT